MIRAGCAYHPHHPDHMAHFLLLVHDRLERFERWFEQRFGWFFTNGMKTRPRHPFTGGSRQHR